MITLLKDFFKKSRYINSIYYTFTADNFPSLNLLSTGQPNKQENGVISPVLNSIEVFLDRIRTSFWSFIARRSRSTKMFYQEPSTITNIPNELKPLFEDGCIVIENVLSEEDYKVFEAKCHQMIGQTEVNGDITETYQTIDFAPLAQSLQKYTDSLLSSSLEARLQFSYIKSESGSEVHMEGFNTWHVDRFVPYMKALYFPLGCNWMPFERVKMAPSKFAEMFSVEQQQKHYFDLPEEFSSSDILQCYVKPNTIVLGYNNILHRRSPIEIPGERSVVYMDWTQSFTHKQLITGLFR